MQVLEAVERRFGEFGLPLEHSVDLVLKADPSTLFITAGMQPLKARFERADHTNHGSIQNCLRTNDLDSVGDGQHLTFFQMLGSFGFATYNYEMHVELWHSIIRDLNLKVDLVRCHGASGHEALWLRRGYDVQSDEACQWSDGTIGGFCSEMFVGDLEVGNLVNPLGHSVDVGFGLERLVQLVEGKARVDESSLFECSLDPISRDHFRALNQLAQQGIRPSNKLQGYVCRRLLRRFIRLNPQTPALAKVFEDWLDIEKALMASGSKKASRYFAKHGAQSLNFWWDSFGLMPEDVSLLEGN